MIDQKILIASSAAAYLYVVSPGPAFLALFTLSASKGRTSGAYFICGHLVGDITWGALAVAAIIGANQLGGTLFEALGFGCGVYLIYLGARAVMTRKDAAPRTVGARRPLATGLVLRDCRTLCRPSDDGRRPSIAARSRGGLSRRRRDSYLRRRPPAGAQVLLKARRDRDAGRRRDVHRFRGEVDL